ncbi:MAG: AbrB/MazE/SpoVT family DNA-binding domain-containing protein [Deinococcus sp.]|uniref:AbrB/MazE/SpoVT family DNA-binding domain-containing protein n=1 Tax=Deinococcus sp. TaxID=47478 RepID=UPI0026DDA97D|nr:AbrB/MazE/SpoVT family DNA-binding domain-containing protein [Deinococcus sp.]MDO4244825.1 AbrB/MazE/SpoVT family DNA-binding domain-containing protein [Deinococcus sp.]
MSHSTITSKGQVTIPVEIREALSLKKGDKLVWRATETGLEAAVERVTGPDEVFGMLRQYAKVGTTHEQERAAVAEAFARGECL